jgi:septum formation protein
MNKIIDSKNEKGIVELLGQRKLILASSSPRRKQILSEAHVRFEIRIPPNINEESLSSDPVEHVISVSRAKAESVSPQIAEGIILGADTIVVLNGEILGKPEDKNEALVILKKLSGRTHKVYTGVTLVNKFNDKIISDYDSTEVTFNQLDEKRIESYIDTKEPMDKAGAYGIQGMGAFLVKEIKGNLDNVIGLPTEKLKEMLIKII